MNGCVSRIANLRRVQPPAWGWGFGLAAFFLAVGCGRSEPEPMRSPLSVNVPWSAALAGACTNPSGLTGLTATLRIGGQTECELTVNTSTRAAEGTCDALTIGRIRPLMLVYSLPGPSGHRAATLGYVITSVDLTKETLEENAQWVEVDFGAARVVNTPASLADLRSDANGGAGTDPDRVFEWAIAQIDRLGENLDRDGDGCANVVEACDGNLFVTAGSEVAACSQ